MGKEEDAAAAADNDDDDDDDDDDTHPPRIIVRIRMVFRRGQKILRKIGWKWTNVGCAKMEQ